MDTRYVMLGDVGIAINSTNLPTVNQVMALAGVRLTGEYVTLTLGTRVAQEDKSLVEFECRRGPDHARLSRHCCAWVSDACWTDARNAAQ